MERGNKVYVKVTADFMPDKTILPRQLVWEDGRVYAIDPGEGHPARRQPQGRGCGLRYLVSSGGGRPSSFWRTETPGLWSGDTAAEQNFCPRRAAVV